jgi:hypothetical protein
MADKKRLVLACAHTGGAVNGIGPVARLLRQQGHSVAVYLQKGQSADESYRSGGKVKDVFGELDVYGRNFLGAEELRHGNCDAVICSMSPVTGFNILNLEISALNCGLILKIPVFGVSDFPGSCNNTNDWREFSNKLTTLFSPMPEPSFPGKCIVSGWGALEKWRNKDVCAMAHAARRKLGTHNNPVLYVSFSPERESPLALEHLAVVIERAKIRGIYVVVNRHGREKTIPIDGNARRYQRTLELLAESNAVIDHSPEFGDLSLENDYAVANRFRPKEFLSYQEALALTFGNGLMLSFFSTDALIAPYLASQEILSACWLDPVFGGAVLRREKKIEALDFPYVYRPTNDDHLVGCIRAALCQPNQRLEQLSLLTQNYPFPEKPASQIIVDEILRQLG